MRRFGEDRFEVKILRVSSPKALERIINERKKVYLKEMLKIGRECRRKIKSKKWQKKF